MVSGKKLAMAVDGKRLRASAKQGSLKKQLREMSIEMKKEPVVKRKIKTEELPRVDSVKSCPACGTTFAIFTDPITQAYPTYVLRTCKKCGEKWKEQRADCW